MQVRGIDGGGQEDGEARAKYRDSEPKTAQNDAPWGLGPDPTHAMRRKKKRGGD
jgi:hypothetical protein